MTNDTITRHQELTTLIAFTDGEDHVHTVRVTAYVRKFNQHYRLYVDIGGVTVHHTLFNEELFDYDSYIKYSNHPDRVTFEYEGFHILVNRTYEGLIIDLMNSKDVLGSWAATGDELLEDESIQTQSRLSFPLIPLHTKEDLLTLFAMIKAAGLLYHADDEPYEVFEDADQACAIGYVYQLGIRACDALDLDIHDIALTTLNTDNEE